ncbi:cuticle protein CP1246-like [Portunus trituberculatus]|uniref:cuticle protein CP1246-like n=1 Tax=Portunus trituberculatus TaxID=210409 RepID=UPI001E1CCD42|nr:cuticle protein CP1246-like [Portunus trituberculatus]XP_045114996.1 cuticle protein CP1246-like [Portunus trituberculatus]XP_045114998.1 cuticle protein CP1246-like [Portunus trituberculatus]
MKLLVAICLMAASVSAQYGDSGVVHPDGRLEQFTREQADNIAAIGSAGVIMHDGRHVQFGQDMAAAHNNLPRQRRSNPHVLSHGPSGVIFKNGKGRQLGRGVTMVLSSDSGTIFSDGRNIQHSAKKRSAPIVGDSAIITPGGKLIQFPHGVSVVVAGPSAAQLSNGQSIQYEH